MNIDRYENRATSREPSTVNLKTLVARRKLDDVT
jgi:hypothetical protein